MQQNIKVRLTVYVPGAQQLSSQECDKNPKHLYNYQTINLNWSNKKGKKKTEQIQIKLCKSKLVKQVININEDSYYWMIGNESFPTLPSLQKKFPPRVWTKMSKKERLEVHLKLTSETLQGVKFSYEILDD